MRNLIFSFLLSAIAAPPVATGESLGQMIVTTETATVELRPSLPGRRLLTFSELKFSLTIEPSCPAHMRIQSVSISAADSNETFKGNDLQAQPLIKTTIVIPRGQAAVLAVVDFCTEEETIENEPLKLRVRAAYTAALSLRCVSDEEESVFYLSQPLDVTLSCLKYGD